MSLVAVMCIALWGYRQTGACLVGYDMEKPDYDAWTPQLRSDQRLTRCRPAIATTTMAASLSPEAPPF